MSRQININVTTDTELLIDSLLEELSNDEILGVVKDIDNYISDYDFTENLLKHALDVMLAEATVRSDGTVEFDESTDPAVKAALLAYFENRRDEEPALEDLEDEEIDFEAEFGSITDRNND